MSEFLAEARILVRPDTTKFRALLEAELAAAIRPISVPVVPVVAGGLNAATAQTAAFTSAQAGAAAETQAVAAALEKEAIAATAATGATAGYSRSLGGATKGAVAQTASLFGLRAGTLAASTAFIGGTVAVLAFAKSVQSAASLQTELNVFRVTAGATADEMARVSAAAQQLGRDITLPGVTANDAAVALTELSKAGLSVQDSLAGARGALQLATAAQIDNVTATKLVAGALNAFQLAGTDAVRVADLLTGAAKESQGEISDMGTALSQVAAVSQQFGVSISDTVTLLTELAQAGLAGGRAGTSLRVAFLRLVNPTAQAAKALAELNIHVRDANGNLRPGVFTDIADALKSYTKAQQDATLATIFGSDAIRAAAIIGNKGTLAFLQTSAAITEVGLAQQQAAARTSGLAGSAENVKNQFSALGLTIGQVSTGPLTVFLKGVGTVLTDVNLLADGIVTLGKDFGHLAGDIGGSIPVVNKAGNSFESAAKKALLFGAPFVGVFAAAGEAAKKLGLNSEDASKKTDAFGNSIDGVTGSVSDLNAILLQSAADSKVFTESVTAATAALLQSAADSRVDLSKLGQTAAPSKGLQTKQIQNIIGGFDAKEVRDRINHDNKQLLADLQAEQDFLQNQLQRQFVKNRPALKKALEQSLLGVVNDIDQIQGKAASDSKAARQKAEQAARDAAAAASKQEQALLSQFGVARDQQANKIAAAAQTTGLKDDITAQKRLAALVRDQIAAVRERISIEGGRAAAVTALKAILIQVQGSLKSLAEQQQQAQEQQRQALLQGINLDVDLAQITGNQAAEVKARNRAIAVLNKELAAEAKAHGKTTVAYKTIRNEIAAQNAALKEIVQERNKGQSIAQASFDFLQTQQGFASSLLGNLIPTGSTAGLVGGGSVQAALPPLANAAEGKSQSGVTAGMGNTTNNWLRQIYAQLKELNGETKAPEATWQRRISWSWGDGVGGG